MVVPAARGVPRPVAFPPMSVDGHRPAEAQVSAATPRVEEIRAMAELLRPVGASGGMVAFALGALAVLRRRKSSQGIGNN
jgi:MYXO-CTERM domain-containing protein